MKHVSSETIARTIILVLALVNQVLAILGKGTIDIAENDLYQVVSLLFTIVSTIAAWWKNNSFTEAAVEADERMKELKKDG
ncbi:phage holin [Enterococcus sp. BWM-S5]|uniref:Phage holin n=1 Tax=Enterococcus larvae TaxID=2794352 RepID=A0ABS4CGE5_9ENTE|nr:phage holin [Enterococcus larvae]MBP1045085.1 phage holin [Enterococcus larvae]